MVNTLNAKFTLAGAPARADYAATSFIVIPNAPPILPKSFEPMTIRAKP